MIFRLFVLGLCVSIGWALSYLRLPPVGKNDSFWIGFLACLALVSFLVCILYIWNKNLLLLRIIGKNKRKEEGALPDKINTRIWIMVSIFVAFGGVFSGVMINRQNKLLKTYADTQNQRVKEQSELIQSIRTGNQMFLMSNLLEKVDDELKDNPNNKLSHEIIDRIAALSYSLKPYRYFKNDSLSENKLSPERGQLLLSLSILNIDSNSFAQLKHKTSFIGADLRGADLTETDLSGVNLRGADLRDADLTEANLTAADLQGANLWGAKLNKGILNGVNLRRTDLRWAEMNGVEMKHANLNGADMTNAKLRKANLRKATFRMANMEGVMLNETDLREADFLDAVLINANLTNVNLTEAVFRRVDLDRAILVNTELTMAEVEDGWLEKLTNWQITGADDILQDYRQAKDSSIVNNRVKYLLEKVKK